MKNYTTTKQNQDYDAKVDFALHYALDQLRKGEITRMQYKDRLEAINKGEL